MIFTMFIGLIAGIAMVIYRGLYFGPWNQVINTMGVCLAASIVFYILLQIIAGIGSFFLKIVLIILITIVVFFGGTKLWNSFNPDNPIKMPTAESSHIMSKIR